MIMFNLQEYLELQEAEVIDWWTDSHLPHPGCPISFAMMRQLILMVHRIPEQHVVRKRQAWLLTAGQVHYEEVKSFHSQWEDQPVVRFYFPTKGKEILVPLDIDFDTTDMMLIRVLYV